MAYPEYFVEQDSPHGCAANKSLVCPRGMIDITTEHGFEFVDGLWKSLVDTFPGGEYVSSAFARCMGDCDGFVCWKLTAGHLLVWFAAHRW